MFKNWIKNLQQDARDNQEPEEFWVERLTALLLVEIARSDLKIDDAEVGAIEQALQVASPSMTTTEIQEMISTAKQDANAATSMHEQFRQINSSFTHGQKCGLVEQMWRVAMADGDLDKYEEYTIRELCERLHLSHQDFIQAKLKVLDI